MRELKNLNNYFNFSQAKNLKGRIREILNILDKFLEYPRSKHMINELKKGLYSYTRDYIEILKLEYAMEWIDKRLPLISDENVKNQLMSIKQDFSHVMLFHKKAADIIYPLQEYASILSHSVLTDDLANEIVKLIIKLKELNFQKEGSAIPTVRSKIFELINGLKNDRYKQQNQVIYC